MKRGGSTGNDCYVIDQKIKIIFNTSKNIKRYMLIQFYNHKQNR
jgi:hypothetical protein